MWSWLTWWRPPCLLRAVVVNLKSDDSTVLRGVLWRSRGSWLVLRDVSMHKSGEPPITVLGEAVIHRSNVTFLQALP